MKTFLSETKPKFFNVNSNLVPKKMKTKGTWCKTAKMQKLS
jgi:hypothetical protein